jgi:hypothetical protein
LIDEVQEWKEVPLIQLKSNHIPAGLVPLESIFDRSDRFLNKAEKTNKADFSMQVDDINIGFEDFPRNIKIGKACIEKERKEIIELVREYKDVFVWSYDEMKTFDQNILNHEIPLRMDAKPFRRRLRFMNPKVAPTIQKELQKLYEAKIIERIRYSEWVSNCVPVRKKNGEIRVCIDFKNLNRVCLKDNYPFPNMDHILQTITGSEMMSVLDGFLGYNQIAVAAEDCHKTAFITPWGTYSYIRMPFGLMNAGATFQQAMDHAFKEFLFKFIVVYQDDITVYSKKRSDHISHLRVMFDRCRQLGILVNPKKSLMGIFEAKLLGHIVSKGVRIDPEGVNGIHEVPLPSNKKAIQSFLGQIGFVRRFIPNFAEIVKPITDMLKKGHDLTWSEEVKQDFENIKQALSRSAILASLDYSHDFQIFSFAFDHTIACVLLQKNMDGHEQPIAYMSRSLQGSELNTSLCYGQGVGPF